MASKKDADLSFLLAKVIALRYNRKGNKSSRKTIYGEPKGGQPVTGLAFLGQIAMVEKRLITAKKRVERYKADMDYVNRLSQTGKVSQTSDVTRNESMVIKYMEAVDQVTALIQEKNAIIDRVEEKLMQMRTINGPEMLRGVYIEYKPVTEVANELHYSRQGAYKLRNRALRELDRILAAEEQNDRQQSTAAV